MRQAVNENLDNRTLLRSSTRRLHELLDSMMNELAGHQLSNYASMLRVHACVLPDIEKKLRETDHLNSLAPLSERWRTGALSSDLSALGISQKVYSDMSFLNVPSFSAGVLYVLEGSRLGNAHLLRRLKSTGRSSNGTRFLSHGNEAGLWKTFVSWLNAQSWQPLEKEQAVQGASAAFAAYIAACEFVRDSAANDGRED